MNKYLMLSAAAVLAATGGANATGAYAAGSVTISFGNDYCDFLILRHTGTAYVDIHDFEQGCGHSFNSYGQGLAAETKGIGKNVDLSDNYLVISGNGTGALNFDISLPLRRGGTYCIWFTSNAVTSIDLGCSTYGLRHADKTRNVQAPTKTTVAAIIEKLRTDTR